MSQYQLTKEIERLSLIAYNMGLTYVSSQLDTALDLAISGDEPHEEVQS
jgi:hypothetical protein